MKKIIGLFLTLFSVNCFAEWTLVSTSNDDTVKIYVDFSTKKKIGGYMRVWSLTDSTRTDIKMVSFKVLEEYDCGLDRIRVLQMTAYSGRMGGGNVLNTSKGDNSWNYITPSTVEERLFKKICN
jgi:hypothetical protein